MTLYQLKLNELRNTIYDNESQINTVIFIRNYIETHFEENLILDYLTQMQPVSKYHLLRLFKKYYGQTPRQYLIDKRIEKAKVYLENGMSVTETCFAVGFEGLGSFSALFKTKTGKTPSTFRKEQLSRSKLN
ncbi:helix-turn-helix domain-containing protein [Winogradskyella poriferorum]|uniref:helix-turn-helix domain-containing protein n=1 Tax=Winogradskyella poriferorum TaxID=307627 RepID=UPI003D652F79